MSSTHPLATPNRPAAKKLALIGGGMVAHRLAEALLDRDTEKVWEIDLYCEEPMAPYDRVALTSYFSGRTPEDLILGEEDLAADPRVTLHVGSAVTAFDTAARTVSTAAGESTWDALVLATGSSA